MSAIQILMTQTFQSWRWIPNITIFTNMSQIYHKYITHKLYILQISQVTNMTNMPNILLGKKIRNIFDLKNIFFLQILSSFSFSLRKKMYFPCPIISPFSFSVFSSPQKNIFSFSKHFPRFPALFFFSSAKIYFLFPNTFLLFLLCSSSPPKK